MLIGIVWGGFFLFLCWLIIFLPAVLLWVIFLLFKHKSNILNENILWMIFPPVFYRYLKKNGSCLLTRSILTIIAPQSLLFLFVAFELTSFGVGYPLPITHSNILSLLHKETGVDIPRFKIVNYDFTDNFPDYTDTYIIKFIDNFDEETIEALNNAEEWEKTGTNEYTLRRFGYEHNETIIVNVKNNVGEYVFVDL